MNGRLFPLLGLAFGMMTLSAPAALAQYSAVTAPFNNASHSYFERMGVGFGGRVGNVFFNNGGGAALPPFGRHDPAADARLGFGLRGNGFNLNFNLSGGSGADTNFSSVAPSITLPNGGTGQIFSGELRPFVTGLVPVVGHFGPGPGMTMVEPRYVSPLAERLARLPHESPAPRKEPEAQASPSPAPPVRVSSAARGDLSLSEIRARRENRQSAEQEDIVGFMEAGRAYEEQGEIGQALIQYHRAAARAQGELKQELAEKILQLKRQQKR